MELLAFQKLEDDRFAERLIVGNMQADYARHAMQWDSEKFKGAGRKPAIMPS